MSNRPIESELEAVTSTVQDLAKNYQGDCLSLLALLRLLENLHQGIRDGLFQDSLPDNRQALYNLLKDIEATGGWPYIHRMKLQLLLANFQTAASDNDLLITSLSETAPPNNRKERDK